MRGEFVNNFEDELQAIKDLRNALERNSQCVLPILIAMNYYVVDRFIM